MSKELTEREENLIKDLLRFIGGDDDFEKEIARACGMGRKAFIKCADDIYIKLGNGRVTTG